MSTFTLLEQDRATTVPASLEADRVRLSPEALEEGLGWQLKPEGFCRGETCIPLPPGAGLVNDGRTDLRAFAGLLGRPLALDREESVACLGTAAGERSAMLSSLKAPDFTLPDSTGKMHRLSDHRGRKILLNAWGSW